MSGVLRFISCIIYNDQRLEFSLDHAPSVCVRHESWRGLPVVPSDVISQGWEVVRRHLREVCMHCCPATWAHEFGKFFICNFAVHNIPLPRQVAREKYERLLSAAPTATLDCSSLFDGQKAIEVIENAVSKHAGRALHEVCRLCTRAACVQ